MGEYVTRIVPMGTHEWKLYMNHDQVESILSSAGGQTIDKAGVMITNPLTGEMREFPNWLRSNYMLMAKRL